jgi:hypothetical protein
VAKPMIAEETGRAYPAQWQSGGRDVSLTLSLPDRTTDPRGLDLVKNYQYQ